jgi:ATP-dependent Clp protease ATP-binding subunit ClpA
MFERFTNRARHVVVRSQEEARELGHNYIGTEHILLGLLGEPDGLACKVLNDFGISLDSARQEVTAKVGAGKGQQKGHIPFTPRAKKTLELSLREALALHHNFIGTEHILLGLIREGDGVAAQILKEHADLLAIRTAVLDRIPPGSAEQVRGRRWLRRLMTSEAFQHGESPADPGSPAEQEVLSATPAADATLTEAARLAGSQPVGSHHLLLAALADSASAAARALTALGLDLDQAKEALRGVDVTGTTDEQPEEAGRRQMVVQVTGELVTVVAADPVIVTAGKAALKATGDEGGGVIRGDNPTAASLSTVWQALHDSLDTIKRAASSAGSGDKPEESGGDKPEKSGPEAA